MDQQLNDCPVRNQARRSPTTLAIKSEQQLVNYQQLDLLIKLLEKQFIKQGLKAGDRLICIAENSLNLILLQLTCMRSGVIFCPLNPRFSEHEIQTRINILNSDFIWLDKPKSSLNLSSLLFDFNPSEKIKSNHSALKINSQRVINIIFTSGSSGLPKAVMHNFSNHFYSALGSQTLIPLKNGDKNLLSLPIFHISGYATVMRTLLAGATLVLDEQKLTVNSLQKQQITHLSLVATQLYRLLEDPKFKQANLSIKHLLLGGSAFSKQLLTETQQCGFNYHLSYGLTEMSSQVATSCNSQSLSILKYREVKIIDGEILLRGKTRFVGYFNKQLENSVIPPEQWFASKDLGIKKEKQLQVIGRKDRLFICAGENIQPEEIESILLSFASVKQAYVIAIDHFDLGQRPVAFIDWQDGQQQTQALDTYIRTKLNALKCPTHYFLLPSQKGLKVSLAALKNQAEELLKLTALKEADPK